MADNEPLYYEAVVVLASSNIAVGDNISVDVGDGERLRGEVLSFDAETKEATLRLYGTPSVKLLQQHAPGGADAFAVISGDDELV